MCQAQFEILVHLRVGKYLFLGRCECSWNVSFSTLINVCKRRSGAPNIYGMNPTLSNWHMAKKLLLMIYDLNLICSIKIYKKRIENIWVNVLLEIPAYNKISTPDVTFSKS